MKEVEQLAPWLDRLRDLPFVRRLAVQRHAAAVARHLRISTPAGTFDFALATTQARPITAGAVAALTSSRRRPRERLLLLAPHVSAPMAERLRARRVDYLDLGGNCTLRLGDQYFVQVEGRRPPPRSAVGARRQREASYQVLFALAARPELADAPVRDLARLAGTGKSAAADVVGRLVRDGVLASTRRGRSVLHRDRLVDRWVAAYVDRARPKWIAGRYHPSQPSVEALEADLERVLGDSAWVWGGSAASVRLDAFYRGPETLVHVSTAPRDLPKTLRAAPDSHGPLFVMVTPIPLAFEGLAPHTAHPLLVYSELVALGDDRSLQAAARLRERYLSASS